MSESISMVTAILGGLIPRRLNVPQNEALECLCLGGGVEFDTLPQRTRYVIVFYHENGGGLIDKQTRTPESYF